MSIFPPGHGDELTKLFGIPIEDYCESCTTMAQRYLDSPVGSVPMSLCEPCSMMRFEARRYGRTS